MKVCLLDPKERNAHAKEAAKGARCIVVRCAQEVHHDAASVALAVAVLREHVNDAGFGLLQQGALNASFVDGFDRIPTRSATGAPPSSRGELCGKEGLKVELDEEDDADRTRKAKTVKTKTTTRKAKTARTTKKTTMATTGMACGTRLQETRGAVADDARACRRQQRRCWSPTSSSTVL